MGINSSPRDDIEGLVYFMVYLLNKQNLPWDACTQQYILNTITFDEYRIERFRLYSTFRELIPSQFMDSF